MQPMPASVMANVHLLQRRIADETLVLDLFQDKIGTLECLTIIGAHFKISELENAISDLSTKFETHHIANLPLLQVETIDNQVYDIKIARIDKLITGEYIKIDELYKKLDTEKMINLQKTMDALQNRLIFNSSKVYASLKTALKHTNYGRKFDGLMISKKAKYLYYYTNDRQKTLGFIAQRHEEVEA